MSFKNGQWTIDKLNAQALAAYKIETNPEYIVFPKLQLLPLPNAAIKKEPVA